LVRNDSRNHPEIPANLKKKAQVLGGKILAGFLLFLHDYFFAVWANPFTLLMKRAFLFFHGETTA